MNIRRNNRNTNATGFSLLSLIRGGKDRSTNCSVKVAVGIKTEQCIGLS